MLRDRTLGAAFLVIWQVAAASVSADPQSIRLANVAIDVVAADFHERGRVDLVVLCQRRTETGNTIGELQLFRNDGHGQFTQPPVITPNQPAPQFGVAADIDGNKRPSLIYVGGQDGQLFRIYRPEGEQTLSAAYDLQLPFTVQERPAAADMFNTAREDVGLALGNQSGILRNDGNGLFQFLRVYGRDSGGAAIAFGQVKANHFMQLVVGSPRLLLIDVEQSEQFALSEGLAWPVFPAQHLLAERFINPDRVDVIACKGASFGLLENAGAGKFPFVAFKTFGNQVVIADAGAGDFDADGLSDFVTLNPYRDENNPATQIHMFAGLPRSLPGDGHRLAIEGRGKRLVVADLNANSRADIIVLSKHRNSGDRLTILLDPLPIP